MGEEKGGQHILCEIMFVNPLQRVRQHGLCYAEAAGDGIRAGGPMARRVSLEEAAVPQRHM